MRLSQWRTNLLKWLNEQIRIDSYSATDPELNQTNAFLPRLEDVSYEVRDTNTVVGKGTQRFQIAKRVGRNTKYRQLPIAFYEGLHSTLSIRFVRNYADIADLQALEFVEISDPVNVVEVGEDTGEWLIFFNWAVQIEWLAEPEEDSEDPPFRLTGINLTLWRDHLEDDLRDGRDPNLSVMDFTTSLVLPEEPPVLTITDQFLTVDT